VAAVELRGAQIDDPRGVTGYRRDAAPLFMALGFYIGGPFSWNLLRRAPERIVAAVLAQTQRVASGGARSFLRDQHEGLGSRTAGSFLWSGATAATERTGPGGAATRPRGNSSDTTSTRAAAMAAVPETATSHLGTGRPTFARFPCPQPCTVKDLRTVPCHEHRACPGNVRPSVGRHRAMRPRSPRVEVQHEVYQADASTLPCAVNQQSGQERGPARIIAHALRAADSDAITVLFGERCHGADR
jgi:hypothetical protein